MPLSGVLWSRPTSSWGMPSPAGVPIQLIGSATFAAPPARCSGRGLPEEDTVDTFGANGILGVGSVTQDCGVGCTAERTAAPAIYFALPQRQCHVRRSRAIDQPGAEPHPVLAAGQ